MEAVQEAGKSLATLPNLIPLQGLDGLYWLRVDGDLGLVLAEEQGHVLVKNVLRRSALRELSTAGNAAG